MPARKSKSKSRSRPRKSKSGGDVITAKTGGRASKRVEKNTGKSNVRINLNVSGGGGSGGGGQIPIPYSFPPPSIPFPTPFNGLNGKLSDLTDYIRPPVQNVPPPVIAPPEMNFQPVMPQAPILEQPIHYNPPGEFFVPNPNPSDLFPPFVRPFPFVPPEPIPMPTSPPRIPIPISEPSPEPIPIPMPISSPPLSPIGSSGPSSLSQLPDFSLPPPVNNQLVPFTEIPPPPPPPLPSLSLIRSQPGGAGAGAGGGGGMGISPFPLNRSPELLLPDWAKQIVFREPPIPSPPPILPRIENGPARRNESSYTVELPPSPRTGPPRNERLAIEGLPPIPLLENGPPSSSLENVSVPNVPLLENGSGTSLRLPSPSTPPPSPPPSQRETPLSQQRTPQRSHSSLMNRLLDVEESQSQESLNEGPLPSFAEQMERERESYQRANEPVPSREEMRPLISPPPIGQTLSLDLPTSENMVYAPVGGGSTTAGTTLESHSQSQEEFPPVENLFSGGSTEMVLHTNPQVLKSGGRGIPRGLGGPGRSGGAGRGAGRGGDFIATSGSVTPLAGGGGGKPTLLQPGGLSGVLREPQKLPSVPEEQEGVMVVYDPNASGLLSKRVNPIEKTEQRNPPKRRGKREVLQKPNLSSSP
jgi:hypothetical protein